MPITVVIPAYNEEVNLPCALESVVDWADQVIVVDSYSRDRTVEITASCNAEVVQHPYDNMAAQRMWGLELKSIRNEWIFNLDADERLTDVIKAEIAEVLKDVSAEVGSFAVRRKHIFMGRWMKHGGDYIWLTRLVRRGCCRVVKTPFLNEHTIIQGRVGKLKNDFLHLPQKTFVEWIERQNRGALKYTEAMLKIVTGKNEPDVQQGEHNEGPVRTWLNYKLFYRMPFVLRPFIRFFVNYFVKGGFLDGWQGYVYHTVNDFIYPFFVYVYHKELTQSDAAKRQAEKSLWR